MKFKIVYKIIDKLVSACQEDPSIRSNKYHYIVIFHNNDILQHLCENKDLGRKMQDS